MLTIEQKTQRLAEWARWKSKRDYNSCEACGQVVWFDTETPSYFTDLNAVHELEMRLGNSEHPTQTLWFQYINWLIKICGDVPAIFATAAQRAEALGITLGLWKEGNNHA